MKHKAILFFGIVGAGKGTQVELLQNELTNLGEQSLYIYPGNEYRNIGKEDSYISERVQKTMDEGNLLPDSLTDGLVVKKLMEKYLGNQVLIFDGYPRSIQQSQTIAEMFAFYGIEHADIILVDISEEESLKRLLARGRSDDSSEGIQKRISVYKKQVYPSLEDLQTRMSVTTHTIDGEQSIEEVFRDIKKALVL